LNWDEHSRFREFAFRYFFCREYSEWVRKYNFGVSSAILRNPKERFSNLNILGYAVGLKLVSRFQVIAIFYCSL
jgi:hypothetical protein